MDKELLDLINTILSWNNTATYPALKNLFKHTRTPFCHFDIIVGHKPLFRSRRHTINDPDFFCNEKDLTYRPDAYNITSFGRCSEPGQNFFYASDNIEISLSECFDKKTLENLKPVSYITTGIWKFIENIMVAPIFEPENVDVSNDSLIDIGVRFKNYLAQDDRIPQKELLLSTLQHISNEFSKPFSDNTNTYLYSAAFTNYVLESIDNNDQNKRIQGIVYPTCKGILGIRDKGLNYAFKPWFVGFGGKIELVSARRGKLIKEGLNISTVEVIDAKSIDRNTGEITW